MKVKHDINITRLKARVLCFLIFNIFQLQKGAANEVVPDSAVNYAATGSQVPDVLVPSGSHFRCRAEKNQKPVALFAVTQR